MSEVSGLVSLSPHGEQFESERFINERYADG